MFLLSCLSFVRGWLLLHNLRNGWHHGREPWSDRSAILKAYGFKAEVRIENIKHSGVWLSYEQIVKEELEKLGTLTSVRAALECELQEGQENEWTHQFVEEDSWRVH